MHTLRK